MDERIVTVTLFYSPEDEEWQWGCLLSNIPPNRYFDMDTVEIYPRIAE